MTTPVPDKSQTPFIQNREVSSTGAPKGLGDQSGKEISEKIAAAPRQGAVSNKVQDAIAGLEGNWWAQKNRVPAFEAFKKDPTRATLNNLRKAVVDKTPLFDTITAKIKQLLPKPLPTPPVRRSKNENSERENQLVAKIVVAPLVKKTMGVHREPKPGQSEQLSKGRPKEWPAQKLIKKTEEEKDVDDLFDKI